jgi:hypothetical protein
MNAYVVKAFFPTYSNATFYSWIISNESKEELATKAAADGWRIKSVKPAQVGDVEAYPEYHGLLKELRAAVHERDQERLQRERQEREAAATRQAEAERLQRAGRARREEQQRAARALATRRAAGDLLAVKLERGAGEISLLRVIRQKLGLFNVPSCMNREALFHSVTVDAANFQGAYLDRFPSTCKILDAMIQSFNVWFQLRLLVQQAESEMRATAAAVQDDIRAIGSRTYTYGGSGWGLMLSASAADSAVRQDEAAIRSLEGRLSKEMQNARDFAAEAANRMAIHEWRLIKVHEILSALVEQKPSVSLHLPENLVSIALAVDA